MIGNPYATPLPGSYGYPTKPAASGMPTQYQETPPKHWDGTSGDKFPLPGGAPGIMSGSELQGPPDQPPPYSGLADLDGMMQRRKENEQHRQMLAKLLAGQQQPQGPAPYANSSGPVQLPPPVAEASPWSVVTAAINGLAEGYKKSKGGQQPTNEGANAFWGSNGGMKG